MSWLRYDVFLSYSRKDKERVQPLLAALRQLGYRVFFDEQSIEYGDEWKKTLERSIRASRTLVLCWSENARPSDYITYEYSRAETLHKRVYPWILDSAPLPKMLELQAIKVADGAEVANLLRPRLGWPLTRRRALQALVAGVLAIVLAFCVWFAWFRPLEFHGEIDDLSHVPIAGVEVVVTTDDNSEHTTQTDTHGKYSLILPRQRSEFVSILYRKKGYEGDAKVVRIDQQFNAKMPPDEPTQK